MPVSGKAIKKALKPEKRDPLWQGPENDGPLGGISQSLLTDFLVDRERFRLLAIEGLRTMDQFDHKLEFGNLWHACEESNAAGGMWPLRLEAECEKLSEKYPLSRQAIHKWKMTIATQFPIYLDYWSKTKRRDGTRKSLMQEEVFHVAYELPSTRVVYLRGKWDEVYCLTHKRQRSIVLQETKTKSELDEMKIRQRLLFDLQTLLYIIALDTHFSNNGELDLVPMEIDYNVIRRPFSGGEGNIKQHQPTKKNPQGESESEFYRRLAKDYIAKEPKNWFMNITVGLSSHDIERFKRKLLNPILENLCDWYTWMTQARDIWSPDQQISIRRGMMPVRTVDYSIHWQMPYLFNPFVQGWTTEFDHYLESGTEVGLKRVDTLFRELEPDADN